MKKIQTLLIKPFVEKMEKEWEALYQQVVSSAVPEAKELCPLVQSQLSKLRGLIANESLQDNQDSSSQASAHDFIRQSKMDFRSAERRWKRHLVSTARVKTRLANHSDKFLRPFPPQGSIDL